MLLLKDRRFGVAFLTLACAIGAIGLGADASALDYAVAPVALEGDLAPQAAGTYGEMASGVSLNEQGDIGFVSLLSGGAATQGTWVIHRDGTSEVVLDTDTPPTVPGEAYTQMRVAYLNDSGEFVFKAGLSGPPSGEGWLVQRASGLELVVRVGDSVPGLPGVDFESNPDQVRLLSSGDVLLGTRLARNPGDGSGLFIIGETSTDIVVTDGDTIPLAGSPVFSFVTPAADANSSGDVVFYAEAFGLGIRGVFTRKQGSLIALAVEGDPAPVEPASTFSFASTPTPSINEAGQSTFTSHVEATGDASQRSGVFVVEPGGSPVAILLEGDPVPGAQRRSFASFGDSVINAVGAVAILAVTQDAHGGYAQGIYLWRHGTIEVVVESGMLVPDTGGAVLDGFSSWFDFNDSAEVAFRAQLDDGRNGVFLATRAVASVPALAPLLRFALAAGLACMGAVDLLRRRTQRIR